MILIEDDQMQSSPQQTPDFLYNKLVANLIELIDSGTLSPGERIPSIRSFAHQQSVSVSTVLQAYRKLEDLGIVRARPQSGYYVRCSLANRPDEPLRSRVPELPNSVQVGTLVTSVCSGAESPDLVQFGAAVPSAELLPAKKLGRMLAAAVRNEKASLSVQLMPQGSLQLRKAIARRLLEAGCSVGPEEVIVTSGCLESIGLCLRALTRPGDIVAVESPTYFGVLQALERLHLQALEIPTGPCDGIDLEILGQALQRHPVKALVVTPNGHNPLGSVMSDSSRQALVTLAAQHTLHIVEDDVYGDLCFTGSRPKSLMAFDKSGLVIQCGSFCKTLAPGYRVGWLLPGSLSTEIMKMKFASSLGAASPCQMAIAEFLERGGFDHHLRGLRSTLQENLDRMTRLIGESFPDGSRVSRPDGGIVLWVELPTGVDSIALYSRAMDRGIGLTPGPIFSASGGYRNCIRLNAAVRWTAEKATAVQTIGRLAQTNVS